MASTAALYTHEVLALATRLADYPAQPGWSLHGSSRAQACGSVVEVDLTIDAQFSITGVGIAAQACAIGQAAAAIFAAAATGQDAAGIAAALNQIKAWLAGSAALPDWPDFSAIAAARDFPGRHGAIVLAWLAASSALSTSLQAG